MSPSPLTWVAPADLLAHELVAGAEEGKRIDPVRRRWLAAGGIAAPPHGGARAPAAGAVMQALAAALLDDLDALAADPALDRTDPTELVAIEAQSTATQWVADAPDRAAGGDQDLRDRVHGGWLGRASGCLLGKPVEKIPREGIREILQSQGRWPLRSWFTADGLPADVAARWPWNRRSAGTSLAENIDGMPEDDDLNFALLALSVLERHGHAFTTEDVAVEWLAALPAGRVFTAERAAYRNLLLGHVPPTTATRHNPYRQWIGAQIRADLHGWSHPGDPRGAARAAWRDARLSHTRAGVHGAMCVAAMCAVALTAKSVDEVLDAGLSVVPPRSRYAAAVRLGRDLGRGTAADEECIDVIAAELGHLHWVHVLPNTALVAFALTRSEGNLEAGICTVVTGGWDTDSNGATVGSVCGALNGAKVLPSQWIAPLHNRLSSTLPGFDGIGFDELADRTVAVAAR